MNEPRLLRPRIASLLAAYDASVDEDHAVQSLNSSSIYYSVQLNRWFFIRPAEKLHTLDYVALCRHGVAQQLISCPPEMHSLHIFPKRVDPRAWLTATELRACALVGLVAAEGAMNFDFVVCCQCGLGLVTSHDYGTGEFSKKDEAGPSQTQALVVTTQLADRLNEKCYLVLSECDNTLADTVARWRSFHT